MTYSYDPAKLKERGKDQMRFELGDTLIEGGAKTCALSDEEYESILTDLQPGKKSWLTAKLYGLDAILLKLSYQVDTKIDVLQYGFGDRAELWRKLRDDLSRQISTAYGGIPTMATTAKRKPPYFYTDMMENTRK